MIDVLIVDDQNTVRNILESYLEGEPNIRVVGFAANGQEAIDQISVLQPDVVLMDLEMPTMDGLTATKVIADRFVTTKVLILTVNDNDYHLNQALQNGAKGYLLKTATADELINAIFQVNRGYFHLGLELVEKYLHKILKLESDADEVCQLQEKVKVQSETLEKIDNQFSTIKIDLEQKIVKEVERSLDRHKAFLVDNSPNIEFRVDSVDHRLKKLEKNVYYISKLQAVGFLIVLAIATFSIVVNLSIP